MEGVYSCWSRLAWFGGSTGSLRRFRRALRGWGFGGPRAAWLGERSVRGGFRASEVEPARLRCCWPRGRVERCLRDVCCAAVASQVDPWCAWDGGCGWRLSCGI